MRIESHNTVPHRRVSVVFAVVFMVLGMLNMINVHPVPGLFYAVLALVYLPWFNRLIYGLAGFAIPLWIKVLAGLIVLWGTLGVGDLMEMAETWMLRS